jgi:GT2 family glycosyltransferase
LNRVRFHGFKIGICRSAVGYHANQGRNLSQQQELHLDYIEYRQTVKNLNLNLFVTIIHAGLKSCHRSFLYFIALRFKMTFLTLSKYLLVLKDFSQLIKERKASRQVGAYLRQNFDIDFF